MPEPLFCGQFTPPADMIAAARRDLNEEDFAELMRETGGKPPTHDQLVAKVEARRARP